MNRLYASGCRGYDHHVQDACLAQSKIGSFAVSQLLCALLVLCSLMHKYLFTTARLTRLYGSVYQTAPPQEKQHLRVVHVGVVMKFLAVPTMMVSLSLVHLGGYRWSDYLAPYITVLDLTAFSGCCLGASALFDLIQDDNIRPLYIVHHLVMLLAMQGTGALIMTLPTDDERRIMETFQAFKFGTTWLLFSGIGSTVSRATYLFRKLFSWPPQTLCTLFHINFLTFASATVLEAVIIVYLLLTQWTTLAAEVGTTMLLFQLLFTVTKSKTVTRLYMIYKSQEKDVAKILQVSSWIKPMDGKYEK
ncbi:hypothetical protein BJY04DRAFT_219257 [Aspergillus karnatakaensis]|uniref:uncharacterized protein n=1 Tax=Aspergillus karnatakaensis TaxID=1810916 RepID=UPI003CCC99E1